MTVSQALAILPIGCSTLYPLIEFGQLPHLRVSAVGSRRGSILIARAGSEAFVGSARQAREELASC